MRIHHSTGNESFFIYAVLTQSIHFDVGNNDDSFELFVGTLIGMLTPTINKQILLHIILVAQARQELPAQEHLLILNILIVNRILNTRIHQPIKQVQTITILNMPMLLHKQQQQPPPQQQHQQQVRMPIRAVNLHSLLHSSDDFSSSLWWL